MGNGGGSGSASPRSFVGLQGRSGSLQNSRESSRSRDVSPRTAPQGSGGDTRSSNNNTKVTISRGETVKDREKASLKTQLSAEKFKAKTLGMLAEFLHTDREEDALFYFKELRDQENVSEFVFHVVEKGLEGKKESRVKSGQLFLLLLQNKMINEQTIIKG